MMQQSVCIAAELLASRHGTEGWPWYRHHLELDDAKHLEPSGKVVTAQCSRFGSESMDREVFQKARGRAIRNHWTRTNARPATAVLHPRATDYGLDSGLKIRSRKSDLARGGASRFLCPRVQGIEASSVSSTGSSQSRRKAWPFRKDTRLEVIPAQQNSAGC